MDIASHKIFNLLDEIQMDLELGHRTEDTIQNDIYQYDIRNAYDQHWYKFVHPNEDADYTEHPYFEKVQQWYIAAYT
jgi:hypothetical protein